MSHNKNAGKYLRKVTLLFYFLPIFLWAPPLFPGLGESEPFRTLINVQAVHKAVFSGLIDSITFYFSPCHPQMILLVVCKSN